MEELDYSKQHCVMGVIMSQDLTEIILMCKHEEQN